jgi:hypothetical protein
LPRSLRCAPAELRQRSGRDDNEEKTTQEKEPVYHKSTPFIPKKASGWRRDRKLREEWDTLKIMRLAALERTQMHQEWVGSRRTTSLYIT